MGNTAQAMVHAKLQRWHEEAALPPIQPHALLAGCLPGEAHSTHLALAGALGALAPSYQSKGVKGFFNY